MRQAEDVAELARQYYGLVFRFCARRVGCDAAADAAQETFVTAQRAIRRYRGESSLRTWLLGIALNECRRLTRSRRLEAPAVDVSGGSPEVSIVDREVLGQALNRLSQEHREVVLLHEVDGLTYEEIGAVLGVPSGTVKSRLHHAFLNLRRHLGGEL